MIFRRFACASLIPVLGFGFLASNPLAAQTSIPGGSNSNPSTGPAPTRPPDKDKPSGDDKGDGGSKPPGPQPNDPEGKVDCTEDDKDPDQPNPEDGGPPSAPGSVDLSFSLEACPLEYSVSVGKLRLYFDKAEENMGDPVHLQYHSIAGSKITEETTTGLPAGVVKRFTVEQLSGKPLSFDVLSGASSVVKPSGSGARSRARVELRTETGVTTDSAQATRIRQYRSAGGFMEFSVANKNILRWESPTGRSLTFPADPQAGTAAMGLEVLREGTKIRQVKSPAGLLDVVVDADGRGYQVVTYLPSEVGAKASFYSLVPNAKPKRSVHIVHPVGTTKLEATFTDYSPDAAANRVRKLTYTYVETFDGGHEWDMMTEADGMALSSTRHVVPDHDMAGMRRVVREVKDGVGKLLTRKEVVQQFEEAWKGWTDVQEIETPAGNPELRTVRTYRYGNNPTASDFRKANWMMTETGRVYEFKYDAAGRMIERRSPWLDGADGQFITETFSYVPLVAGEVVLPGDERPRTTTVTVGTSNAVILKSYFAAYNEAGRHTVINEDASAAGNAFGSAGNRRKKQIFYAAGTSVESGRLMEVFDENGLKTQYTYVARTGGGLIETITGPLAANGAARVGLTRRTTKELDGSNRLVTTREASYNGSGYVNVHEDVNQYSAQGQLMSVIRTDLKSGRQQTLSSYQYRGDQIASITSVDGAVSGTVVDGFNRQVVATSGAVPAANSPLGGGTVYPARPAIVRTTSGAMIADLDQADWGDRTITTTAGSITQTEAIKADARGRTVEETNADGYSVKTVHSRNGLENTITRPDNSTLISRSFLDGRLKETSGTGAISQYFSYAPRSGGGLVTTVRYGAPNSPRYKITETDMLGRVARTEAPGYGGTLVVTTQYAGASQRPTRIASSAPNNPTRILEYDAYGMLMREGNTVRSSATSLTPSSLDDRIRDFEIDLVEDAQGVWRVGRQYLYPHEGAAASQRYLVEESRTKLAGFAGNDVDYTKSIDAAGNWQEQSVEERAVDRLRIERFRSSAFTGEGITVFHGDCLVEKRQPGDAASTLMSYDSLGRLVATKQARHSNADSVVYATGGNRVVSRTDAAGATTGYTYYPQGARGAGRVAATTFANNTVSRQAFDLRGNKTHEWGSASTPAAYTYSAFDELETISTFRDKDIADNGVWPSGGTPDVTRWMREPATGLLTQKRYADNQGPSYQYSVDGKVTKRTNARGIVTNYNFTTWGELDTVDYADATPDVDIDYDRIGRKKQESNGVAKTVFAYDAATLLLDTETVSYNLDGQPGFEFSRVLDRSNDALGRSTGWQLKNGSTIENQVGYAYREDDGRLASVTSSSGTFSYVYAPNSSLVASVSGPAHTVTNTWETNRDVLDVKENKAGATVVSNFDYTVNGIGQRSKVAQSGTAFASNRNIDWGYDSLRQLISADSSDNAADRSYLYDSIGNRKRSADSLTLPAEDNYTTNSLNQYTSINQGTASNPSYDADGNMTSGLVKPQGVTTPRAATCSWDAENRMASSTVDGVTTLYHYDSGARRVAKATGSTGTVYLYDGWNCIADYQWSNSAFQSKAYYTWGIDVGGSRNAAGGVGGLLQVKLASQVSESYPLYDGNGNVSEYINKLGAIVAHFEFDSFGRTLIEEDTTNELFVRYGTKQIDAETGLLYYGHRLYNPLVGNWLNRDILEELDGFNVYAFVANNPTNLVDLLGLAGLLPDGFWSDFGQGLRDHAGRIVDRIVVQPGEALGNEAGKIHAAFQDPMFAKEYAQVWDQRIKGVAELGELLELMARDPEARRRVWCLIKDMIGERYGKGFLEGGLQLTEDLQVAVINAIMAQGTTAALKAAKGIKIPKVKSVKTPPVPAANRGYISGSYGELRGKALAARGGDVGAMGEIEAAKLLRSEGTNVHFQTPIGPRGPNTADFLVGGQKGTGLGGAPTDVFTPITSRPGNIISGVANKNNQAPNIILNMRHTSVTGSQLGNVMDRLHNGFGATNIQNVRIIE